MNPLLPLNTPEAAPGKPSPPPPPKPDPRGNFEAHVRSPRAPEQGRGDADALPHGRQDAQLHADDAAVPLDVRLAMAGMSGRIYPQGLHATGYLSMLDSDRSGTDGVSVGDASPAPMPAADARSAVAAVAAATSAGAGAEAMAVRVDAAVAAVERNGGSTSDETAELRTGTSGDFAEWARRMVRFSDGTATLWIRDYRLDAPQRHALIEQLHSFARDAGQPLRRIVLNGEDIWREGALNPHTGKGEPHGR